jgi:hypothetical protein
VCTLNRYDDRAKAEAWSNENVRKSDAVTAIELREQGNGTTVIWRATYVTIRAALENLKAPCGVVGELGDKVFFSVLRDAITRAQRAENRDDIIALLVNEIDAATDRFCAQLLVAISQKQKHLMKRRSSVARELRTPKYRPRIVKSKRIYTRKGRIRSKA